MMLTARASATELHALLGATRPSRLSVMNESGPKYNDIAGDLTDGMLYNHVIGEETYAATLHTQDCAKLGAADIDEGGEDALIAGLVRLRQADIHAISISMEAGDHCGGHIWARYDRPYPAAHIRAQFDGILGNLTQEIWPRNQPIRLPFGYHKRAQTFGTLIWIDDAGEIRRLPLDTTEQRAEGWSVFLGMPKAGRPPEPPRKPVAQPRAVAATPARTDGRLDGKAAIASFNSAHTIESVLETYGADKTKDGYTCPCGVAHTHETTITIAPSGKVAYSHSPRCKLHHAQGFDAFTAECVLGYAGDRVALLKVINPPPTRQRRAEAPTPTEIPPQVDPKLLEARRADAARKRQARQDEATAVRAAVQIRAAADEALSENAQLVLATLLEIAGDRDWCRPSITTIAEHLTALRFGRKISERTIRSAIADLEEARYIESTGKGGAAHCTAIRTFLKPDVSTSANFADESIDKNLYEEPREPVSARREPPPALSPKERWSMGEEYEAVVRSYYEPRYEPDAGDLAEQAEFIADPPRHLDRDPRVGAERTRMQHWTVDELKGEQAKCRNILAKPKPGSQRWKDAYRHRLRAIAELLNQREEAAIVETFGEEEDSAGLMVCKTHTITSAEPLALQGAPYKLPAPQAPPPEGQPNPYGPGYVEGMIARFRANLPKGSTQCTI